jgi:hypothetical protein
MNLPDETNEIEDRSNDHGKPANGPEAKDGSNGYVWQAVYAHDIWPRR